MKRVTLAAAAAICAVGFAGGSALAGSGAEGAAPAFETFDSDGDGQITPAEMQAMHAGHMQDADTDGDGALSLEELQAHAAAHAERMMARLDANGDGRIAPEEMHTGGRAEKRFDRMDTNGDGALSKDEFEAARGRMHERHGHGHGHGD